MKRIMKRGTTLFLALVMLVSLMLSGVTFAETQQQGTVDYKITNPYETVNWSSFNQYKADFHSHSVESDGSNQPAAMIEEHYTKGFDIMALTDHNVLSTTWDRTDPIKSGSIYLTSDRLAQITAGAGRDNRGLLAMPSSDEQSISDHLNTFFAPFNNAAGATLESSIAKCQELGGISHINHPGRYTGGAGKTDDAGVAASSNPATVDKYVNLFTKYSSCVGMEIINKKDGDSASDRILWDNILKKTMPARPVWGFSNDDTHSLSATGFSYNMMLMPENTLANVRNSMEKGTFYSVALVAFRELGASFTATGPAPKITNISVDQKENSITILGENYNTIEWIADGKIIATGNTIDLNNYEDKVSTYIRAQLKGAGGISFTQPFGIAVNKTSIAIGSVTAKTGTDVDVKVTMNNLSKVAGIKVKFTYDASKLTLKNVAMASEIGYSSVNTDVAGEVYFNGVNADGIDAESLDMATITFTVNPAFASGKVPLEVLTAEACDVNAASIILVSSNGSITVAAAPTASNVAFTGEAVAGKVLQAKYDYNDGAGRPEAGTTFRWLAADHGTTNYTAISGATGNTYTVSKDYAGKDIVVEVTPKNAQDSGEPAIGGKANNQVVLLGDMNTDGKVNFVDALKLLQLVNSESGVSALDSKSKAIADVNNDNAVDILDVIQVLKADVGLIKLN